MPLLDLVLHLAQVQHDLRAGAHLPTTVVALIERALLSELRARGVTLSQRPPLADLAVPELASDPESDPGPLATS